MAKTIVKEIIIILLLCLAIILVLGVLLYEYIPNDKIIPEAVAYITPESVKEELNNAETVDESQIIRTYTLDSTDLNNYKRVDSYVPGKPNPFSSYQTNGQTSNQGSGTGSSGTSSGSSNNNSNSNNNSSTSTTNSSSGGYLPDKGTK